MAVQADAVDAPPEAPLPSYLPPTVNLVAQALWHDATLRALPAAELARVLAVKPREASDAIGSVIGLINRVAQGNADAALMPEPSLGGAIGPFMSLDMAMSRYGSHMGPIVRSPTPSPMSQLPDVGNDRQWGAGRASAMHGFHHDSGPTRHGDLGEAGAAAELEDAGAGAVSTDLLDATTQLLTFLQENGCSAAFAGVCGNFQIAYNAEYSPAIAVDDKYGPITQNALARVISDASIEAAAPAACHYAAPAAPVSPHASPAPAPATVAPLQAGMLSGIGNPWVLGIAAAAAGVLILAHSKHPPHWVRRMGIR